MKYKGYVGEIEFDEDAEIFHGEVINTRDVITFQADSAAELKRAFHDSVDDYLAFCESRGEDPEKPYSGQFVTRISPELHREVSNRARVEGKALNAWVSLQLQAAIQNHAGAKSNAIKSAAAKTRSKSSSAKSKQSTSKKQAKVTKK